MATVLSLSSWDGSHFRDRCVIFKLNIEGNFIVK